MMPRTVWTLCIALACSSILGAANPIDIDAQAVEAAPEALTVPTIEHTVDSSMFQPEQPSNSTTCQTNAECLREGKPLLKPRDPSKSHPLRPRQSSTTPSTYSGVISVLQEVNNGGSFHYNFLGYLAASEQAVGGMTSDITQAVHIVYPASMITGTSGLNKANLMFDPSDNLNAYGPYLGASAPYGSSAGGPGYVGYTGQSYGYLTAAASAVPAGAGSQAVVDMAAPPGTSGDHLGVETALWGFSLTYGYFNINWSDGKGNSAPLYVYLTTGGISYTYGTGAISLSQSYTKTTPDTNGKNVQQVLLAPYIPGVFGLHN